LTVKSGFIGFFIKDFFIILMKGSFMEDDFLFIGLFRI
jgi:hypothetical protein